METLQRNDVWGKYAKNVSLHYFDTMIFIQSILAPINLDSGNETIESSKQNHGSHIICAIRIE